MISRVYTPPYRPYTRPNGGSRPAESNPDTEQSALAKPLLDEQSRNTLPAATAMPSAELQSLQLSPQQKVPLNAVLTDFHKTMQTIGIDDATQSEVGVYLHAASLQGSKADPDVPFIKGSLRTAANTVDNYISSALGKPSKVVHDWVDALLHQNIDFRNQKPFNPSPNSQDKTIQPKIAQATTDSSQSHEQATANNVNLQAKLSLEQKANLKSTIEAAKQAQNEGQPTKAQHLLEEARTQLGDSSHPAIDGKIYRLQGRFAEESGHYDQATNAWQKAADRFGEAQLPQKQADSLHQKAALLEDRGQLEEAHATYQQVHDLDAQQDDISLQTRSQQDLGRVSLRLGQTDVAITHLEAAAQQNQSLPIDSRSELFTTLGNAYRRDGQTDKAITAFGNAARSAKQSQDAGLYASSLQQYAAVLLEGGQSERAMKALQVYQRLQNT
jgi:tetratricopeptide (TPR) repeat protein